MWHTCHKLIQKLRSFRIHAKDPNKDARMSLSSVIGWLIGLHPK